MSLREEVDICCEAVTAFRNETGKQLVCLVSMSPRFTNAAVGRVAFQVEQSVLLILTLLRTNFNFVTLNI